MHETRRLVEWLLAELARATGRRYCIDLQALDVESLRELQRLLRDLDQRKAGGGEPGADDALGPVDPRVANTSPLTGSVVAGRFLLAY